jgi:DTW domain-containing protein YfiP
MASETCPDCLKPQHLCVCEAVDPIANRVFVLILQHPQEKAETLGTAHLAQMQLKNAVLRIGLSWPGLKRIIGQDVDYKRWAVLYLGGAPKPGGAKSGSPKGAPAKGAAPKSGVTEEVTVVDAKSGQPVADQASILAGLQGIILLDGTWSQAKTLWWRNPWLLKCRRLVLHPHVRSLYGEARREPRRESVSTLEAAGVVLGRLEGNPALLERLQRPFALLLKKMRAPRRPPLLPPSALAATADALVPADHQPEAPATPDMPPTA